MRRSLLLIAMCVVVVTLPLAAGTDSDTRASAISNHPLEGSFVPNEILIGLKSEVVQHVAGQRVRPDQTGVTSLDLLNRRYAVQQISPVFTQFNPSDPIAVQYGLAGVFKLTVPVGTDIFAMIAEYQRDPTIAYAEPNRIYTIADFPNDTEFNKQWALHNTGQTGGRLDADIDAPEGWDIEKGKPTVLIAIVDTGVDYNHPDLSSGRVRTDLDKDFVNSDDDAMDDHGHGTYCAGIAAADTNNALGTAGVCQGCQILPVKVLDSEGSGTAETVAQGIQYAAEAGARIISMSLGYASDCGCSQTVARAINYASERGSLLIAASGNDYDKERLSYPASSPRVLSVGATDHNDQEADFSNRNSYLDILAPGKDVYSLDLDGGYRTASGTSAATPHVSGAAGLVWSARPALNNVQVWWILYQSADDLPETTASTSPAPSINEPTGGLEVLPYKIYLPGVQKVRSTLGRLNSYRALTASISGQMFAPVDTCSSEPDCAPGCGAEVVLVRKTTVVEDMHLLRIFRDEVLARSPTGQHWITLYERHRLEVATILAADNEFRAQTLSALEQWLPLIRALTNPDSVGQTVLTLEHVKAAETVIAGLAARGGPELRTDLDKEREYLEIAQRLIGADIREAWHELNRER